VIARISIVSFFAFIFLMFSTIPASAGDKDYSAPTWKYDSPGHEYRRFDREHRGDYRRYEKHDWRNTYYDDSYESFRGPLSRDRLIWEINTQGYYWVYNIRPSHRHNYVTAFAFDRRYGGRLVYLRVNKFNGNIFYLRYAN
jgi:hypothetical protein